MMEHNGEIIDGAEALKKEWWQEVSLEDAKTFIKVNITSAARSFIAIGYYLKHIRDNELFLEDGHATIWEFAQKEFGLSKSTASRYMKMNDRFSKNGNSPLVGDKYKDFEKSKLQEMLSLTDEQLEQVTPDMKVKQIREIGKSREVPYYEIEGQMEFEMDFPEIMPEPELQAGSPVFEMDIADLVAGDMEQQDKTEAVAISQQPEDTGVCLHRPQFQCTLAEKDKMTAGDGTDCTHSCCWECVEHGTCRLECYASAQRPKGDVQKNLEPGESSERLSAYNTSKKRYPEGSLIVTEGCEGGHDCFSCTMECEIRQKDRYCQLAPMGNPFSCTTMNVLDMIRSEIGIRCQFIDHDLAFHRAGDGEPDPCCRDCSEACGYRCQKARAEKHISEQESECIDAEFEEVAEESKEIAIRDYDERILKEMILNEQETLGAMQDYWKMNQPGTLTKYLMKIAAYQMLLEAKENAPETEEVVQQELPVMKNNEQRKEWLKTFHEWPVWFEVPEASEVYYRYDLPDGCSLVICEYHQWLKWREKYDCGESPDVVYTREYLLEPGYHYLNDCQSNQTAMIEKLKEIQKKG